VSWSRLIRRQGPGRAIKTLEEVLLTYALYSAAHGGRKFGVGDKELDYLNRPLNTERIVEVPFALDRVRRYLTPRGRCLEVGNVLNVWAPFPHDIVDKYEWRPGVINEDISEYVVPVPYDLIVSVSTLEHVGFDEPQKDPDKPRRAIQNLFVRSLKSGGHCVITFPLGYNPQMDRLLNEPPLGNGEVHVLRRISSTNLWKEIERPDVANLPQELTFDRGRFYGVNAVALCDVTKS